MKRHITPNNFKVVLARFVQHIQELDVEEQKEFCVSLDLFLDELAEQDAFGTEGQNDPRGDQRD